MRFGWNLAAGGSDYHGTPTPAERALPSRPDLQIPSISVVLRQDLNARVLIAAMALVGFCSINPQVQRDDINRRSEMHAFLFLLLLDFLQDQKPALSLRSMYCT